MAGWQSEKLHARSDFQLRRNKTMAQEIILDTEMERESVGPPSQPPKKPNYVVLWVLLALLIVGGAVTATLRFGERRALARETEALSVPNVIVIHPKAEPPQQELILPSTLEAYIDSPIFARTNGYLAHWYHDIGSRVKQGQLLADIETPEVDQELMQARAARDQAEAQLNLA